MNCFCAHTRRAARVLTRHYEQELRPARVTPAQFEVLGVLAARPGLRQAALAAMMSLDQTTLSRNLRPLIRRQWVERTGGDTDRRQLQYRLTPQGETVWQRALPSWERAQQRVEQALGPDAEAVFDALAVLARAAQER